MEGRRSSLPPSPREPKGNPACGNRVYTREINSGAERGGTFSSPPPPKRFKFPLVIERIAPPHSQDMFPFRGGGDVASLMCLPCLLLTLLFERTPVHRPSASLQSGNGCSHRSRSRIGDKFFSFCFCV